jgi:hypothetical protein
VRLIGRLVVAVAGREDDAFDAHVHNLIKEAADTVGVSAVKEGGVGGDAEAALDGFLDAVDGDVPAAFAADGEVVVIALSVEMDLDGVNSGRRRLSSSALVQR